MAEMVVAAIAEGNEWLDAEYLSLGVLFALLPNLHAGALVGNPIIV